MRNIYIGTDFHLWSSEFDKRHPFRTKQSIGQFMDNYGSEIQEDDMFIFLGDLCDPAATDINNLKIVISAIPGYKIMCRGNHDTQDDDFYKEVGFDQVCEVCKIHNLVFSHKPIRVAPDELNIHGHLHTEKLSTSGYQHINAYGVNHDMVDKPILVDDLIDAAAVQDKDSIKSNYWDDKNNSLFEKYVSLENDTYTNIIDLTDMVTIAPMDEAVKLNDSIIDPRIITLQKTLSSYGYGALYKRKVTDFADPNEFVNVYKTLSPKKFHTYRGGVCWDYAAAQHDALQSKGIPHRTYYVELEVPPYYPTHTFTIIPSADKYIYIESSFQMIAGMYIATSIDSIINFVVDAIAQHDSIDHVPNINSKKIKIYEYTPDNSYYGLNTIEFMDKVTREGTRVKVSKINELDTIDRIIQETTNSSLNEILFQDIESTEYWLQDDEYEPGKKKKEPMADGEGTIDEASLTGAASFNDIMRIVNNIPKEEHHYFYHGPSFKNSPHVKYRDIAYVPNTRRKAGAFIEIYTFDDDPDIGIVVMAADPAARGQGLTNKLLQKAIREVPKLGITKLIARIDNDNTHSYNMAIRNGFVDVSSRTIGHDQYRLEFDLANTVGSLKVNNEKI